MQRNPNESYPEFINLKKTSRLVILITLILSIVIGTAAGILRYSGTFYLLLTLAGVSGVLLVLHALGAYRLTGTVLSVAVPILGTLLIVQGHGLNDAGVLVYAITIVFASLLLGRRSVFYFTALNGVLAALVYWVENRGRIFGWQIENPVPSSAFDLLIVEALLLTSSYLVWIVVGHVEKNIDSVLQSEAVVRKAVEERTDELKDTQEELVRSERLAATGQMTATVAHELRNPLGTVRNAVFAIGDAVQRNAPERIAELRELANRNIDRCDNIINELLDFTRYRDLHLESTLIGEWVNEVVQLQSLSGDIEWTRELIEGVQANVDREALRRAMANVLQNAVDSFADPATLKNGRTEKRITVRCLTAAGRLEVHVQDNGPGMPGEVVERLFEPFYSTKGAGVGLGMSIVRNIMSGHEGGVEVQSEVGRGTTVTLWLPFGASAGRGKRNVG